MGMNEEMMKELETIHHQFEDDWGEELDKLPDCSGAVTHARKLAEARFYDQILALETKTHRIVGIPQTKIICLCGSTKFKDAFTKAQLDETLAGKIVLTIGCNMKSDTEIFGHLSKQKFEATKTRLDELHKRKIDLADEVMILNVGGYIGESTRSELNYALKLGKPIKYLEEAQ